MNTTSNIGLVVYSLGDGNTPFEDYWKSINLEADGSLYTYSAFQIIDNAFGEVYSDIAPSFSSSVTYVSGDYVMHEGSLYKYISLTPSSGSWDGTKWNQTKVTDEINNLIEANPTPESGETTLSLNYLKIKDVIYHIEGGGGPAGDLMVNITWSALKYLRDNNNLVPGLKYRITDYTCTTVQSNTSSAGHLFDIIVTADSTSSLNAIASATHHNGDTYFSSSKLEAWQIWYCLDNDTNRFAWADTANGRGVIYRMIDEFNNDVPYDFKNMLFRSSNYYTFNKVDSSVNTDRSLNASVQPYKDCTDNFIGQYITGTIDYKQHLNNTIFLGGAYSNKIGWYSCNNTFDGETTFNTIYEYFQSNTINGEFRENIIGVLCTSNTFGNNFRYNTLGANCNNNTFDNAFMGNTLASNCDRNNFSSSISNIHLGNKCSYISIPSYSENIIIDEGCIYLSIVCSDTSASSSNKLQNIHIHSGVIGTSLSSKKTITVPDRALTYVIDYYPTGSTIEYV